VLAAHRRNYDAFMDNTPAGVVRQQELFGRFAKGLREGKITIGESEHDLTTEKGVADCIATIGFTSANAKRAMSYYLGAQNRKVDMDVLNVVAKQIYPQISSEEMNRLVSALAIELANGKDRESTWATPDKAQFYKKFTVQWLRAEQEKWAKAARDRVKKDSVFRNANTFKMRQKAMKEYIRQSERNSPVMLLDVRDFKVSNMFRWMNIFFDDED
jgi:hypothetical protein